MNSDTATLLEPERTKQQYEYQIGGSLNKDSPCYVVRQADADLYHALSRGEFCYVFNSRQMGKSSLRVRVKHQLQGEGFSCASLDLTRLGSENLTPRQWYKGIISELWRSFGLMGKVNLIAWQRSLEDISPVQQLSQFIEDILLVEVPGKLVIFIDEIDSVKSLDFPTDDFFALIRFCYNQRSENPAYNRLTFALFGVTTPSDLIGDRQRTPFNIGKAIELHGFAIKEVQPLVKGLQEKIDNPPAVLKEILNWTGGQPFLTQKLCQLVLEQQHSGSSKARNLHLSHQEKNNNSESPFLKQLVREALAYHSNLTVQISSLVKSQIIENWEFQDDPEHLKTIRNRLLSKGNRAIPLLEMYQQILQQGCLDADNSPEQGELLLSGLVVKQQGKLRVYNQIYAAVFNLSWIGQELARIRLEYPQKYYWNGGNSQEQFPNSGILKEEHEFLLLLQQQLASPEDISAAFIRHLDDLSLTQLEAVAQAIAQHSPAKAQAMARILSDTKLLSQR